MLPSSEEKPLYCLRVPVSTSQLRATYTERETCFLEKLPLPDIQIRNSDTGVSSYTSLMDCFTNFLAFGHGVNKVVIEDTLFDGEKSIDVVDGSRITHKNMKNVLENLTASDNKTK